MKSKLLVVFAVGLVALFRVSTVQAQGMFRVAFRATGKGLGQSNQETNLVITDRDIIAASLAANGVASGLSSNYALVYNVTNDSLQVVNNTNGTLVSEAIQFEGGAATTDQSNAVRFTYMFLPNETTAFGTALISEKVAGVAAGSDINRARLVARLQFALTGNELIGASNSLSAISTNAPFTNAFGSFIAPSAFGTSPSVRGSGLAINGIGSPVGGGLSTFLDPIAETNSLSLGSPATPPFILTNGFAFGSSSGAMATAKSPTSALSVGSSPNLFISTASLGATNATNVRIYTGTFVAGAAFQPNSANSQISGPAVFLPPADTNNGAGSTSVF